MNISVEFDDKSYVLDVPESLVQEATDFFARMDDDMDGGWQMSRWWVPEPDMTQRCQIAADKLMTARDVSRSLRGAAGDSSAWRVTI